MIVIALAMIVLAVDPGRGPQESSVVQTPPPVACQADPHGAIDYAACLAATPRGDGMHSLSAINLGTQAYMEGDPATALRWYDEAETPNRRVQSDVVFHTFRADARHRASRETEALADAQQAWRLMKDPSLYPAAGDVVPLGDDARFRLLGLILPILKTGGDEAALAEAKAAFIALPAADSTGWSNRAGVLEIIDDVPAALEASEHAVALAPNDALVLNNHCFILSRAGQAEKGLGYCEHAVASAGDLPADAQAAIHHSYATSLAELGRCTEAADELAQAHRLNATSPLYTAPLTCTPQPERGSAAIIHAG